MNILRIIVEANPEKEYELKQAINSALDKALNYEDVKKCFCKSVIDDNIFLIEQEWISKGGLESYLESKDYEYLIGAITVLGELKEQRNICVLSVQDL